MSTQDPGAGGAGDDAGPLVATRVTNVVGELSALGGSMFPRFLMSEGMQRLGLLTFNAWALDGYLKVFWREAPLLELWPQVAVLVALTLAFLAAARLLARRWESA
jgi:ABC-2 type transport system permease protein